MTNKTYIIAEVGINANGNIKQAFNYINAARSIGADAVKFQCFWQWPDLKQYEFSKDDFISIFRYAKGIDCFATPFSIEAIDFLSGIGQTIWKVPSGMITNYPYLRHIGKQPGRVIVSTGMSNLAEIEAAFYNLGCPSNSAWLHCTTAYPTRYEDVNLRSLNSMMSFLKGLDVGLSDHTQGIEVPIAAVALGARIIEKHITFNRKSPGLDHKASIEVNEFEKMVKAIRNVEKAMGSDKKSPTLTELNHKGQIRARMMGESLIFTGYSDDGTANYSQT